MPSYNFLQNLTVFFSHKNDIILSFSYNSPFFQTDGSSVDLDHVTYVCRPGQSKAILQWYSDVCGMSR